MQWEQLLRGIRMLTEKNTTKHLYFKACSQIKAKTLTHTLAHTHTEPRLLTTPFNGLGSTKMPAAAAAAAAAASCCLRRAPRLFVGLRVAGVLAPMGVASLSEDAAAFTCTAGSGKMNSCAHSGGNLRLQKKTMCVSLG